MMNKEVYLKNVAESLALLSREVSILNAVNLYDINIVAEDFFPGLLNLIVGRRIEGDTNSKLFFQLFSRRLRSAFCKCIMLSKMLHTAGIDFSFETQKAIDPVVRSTATRCI